jgi:hypothetical protein
MTRRNADRVQCVDLFATENTELRHRGHGETEGGRKQTPEVRNEMNVRDAGFSRIAG